MLVFYLKNSNNFRCKNSWYCMTDDVDKSFFDVLAQLKEIDPDAYDKILKELESKNDEKEI